MLNSLEVYRQQGEKAGTAARQKDQGRVSFFRQWLTRALAMEGPEYRKKAREAWNEGYREGSGFRGEDDMGDKTSAGQEPDYIKDMDAFRLLRDNIDKYLTWNELEKKERNFLTQAANFVEKGWDQFAKATELIKQRERRSSSEIDTASVDHMEPPDSRGRHPKYKHLVMAEIEPMRGMYLFTIIRHDGSALISEDDAREIFGDQFDDEFAYVPDEYIEILN